MQETRPNHIVKAVWIGQQIRDLESQKAVLILERDQQNDLISTVDSKLTKLWIEIGALKHSVGEA